MLELPNKYQTSKVKYNAAIHQIKYKLHNIMHQNLELRRNIEQNFISYYDVFSRRSLQVILYFTIAYFQFVSKLALIDRFG